MINIRNNVFETNSSSTHSITFDFSENGILETIDPINGIITLTGGDFTKENLELTTPIEKANLVAAYCVVYGDVKLMRRLTSILKKHTSAKDIVYDIRLSATTKEQPNTFFMPRIFNESSFYEDEDESGQNKYRDLNIYDIIKSKKLKNFIFNRLCRVDIGIQDN